MIAKATISIWLIKSQMFLCLKSSYKYTARKDGMISFLLWYTLIVYVIETTDWPWIALAGALGMTANASKMFQNVFPMFFNAFPMNSNALPMHFNVL